MLYSGPRRTPMSSKRKPKSDHRPHRIPTQARARATFDAIVDATEQLLAKHGYAAITTNHVADTAGVAIGSLYEYFPDKDAIVAQVARRTVQRILEEIAAAFLRLDPSDPPAALAAWVHAMFVAVGSRRELVRVLSREVPFLWDLEEIRALPEQMIALAKVTRLPGGAEPPPAVNVEAATFLLTVMVSQAVIASAVDRPASIPEEDVERALTQMLTTLVLARAT